MVQERTTDEVRTDFVVKHIPYDPINQKLEFQIWEQAFKEGYGEGYKDGYENGLPSLKEEIRYLELEETNKELNEELNLLKNKLEDLDSSMFNTLFVKYFPNTEKTFHKIYLDREYSWYLEKSYTYA